MKLSVLAVGGVGAVLVALTGCGGDDLPPDAVAEVGGAVITTAAFDERLASAVKGESRGSEPVPYEPPAFDRCVAVKQKRNGAPEGEKGKSKQALRKECEQDYVRLRTQVMEFLIQREWVRREADKVDVEVTPEQARKEFERQKDQAFESAKEYIDKATAAKGGELPELAATGDKKVDGALARAKTGVVSGPLETQFGWWVFEVEKILPATVPTLADAREQIVGALEQQEQQRALDEFATDFREQYREQTVCAEDFEVASCKNGPEKNPTTPAQGTQPPESQQDE